VLARATAGSTTRNTGETRRTPINKQRISTAARQLAALENPVAQVALAVPENPAAPAVRVALAALENPAARAVPVALAALENPAVQAVPVALAVLENPVAQVALAVLENPAVRVALAVLENPVGPAALARLAVAALVNQVEVVEKEALTRSVAISRRGVAAAVPLLEGVAALLKPRATEVAVA
jgi:hypothetical protein